MVRSEGRVCTQLPSFWNWPILFLLGPPGFCFNSFQMWHSCLYRQPLAVEYHHWCWGLECHWPNGRSKRTSYQDRVNKNNKTFQWLIAAAGICPVLGHTGDALLVMGTCTSQAVCCIRLPCNVQISARECTCRACWILLINRSVRGSSNSSATHSIRKISPSCFGARFGVGSNTYILWSKKNVKVREIQLVEV